ncbi:MAG: permease, glycerol uptake facilitator [Mycobacterium sp.]|nr:permease, glycerol uptake facilitator [Mycobacterium sp.]
MDTVASQAATQSVNLAATTDGMNDSSPRIIYSVEAIGTFCLVATVGAAVCSTSPFASLGIGAVLMVMIYAGGHLAGGHYNPAVTLALLLRRRIGLRGAAAYWSVQLGAGLLAAVVVRAIVSPAQIDNAATMMLTGRPLLAAYLAELLFTFVLSYVVLDAAAGPRRRAASSFYDLAIGFTVIVGAFAVAAISNGAFNPAVKFTAAVTDMFAWPTLWVYVVAQVIAGAAAGVAFLALDSPHT